MSRRFLFVKFKNIFLRFWPKFKLGANLHYCIKIFRLGSSNQDI